MVIEQKPPVKVRVKGTKDVFSVRKGAITQFTGYYYEEMKTPPEKFDPQTMRKNTYLIWESEKGVEFQTTDGLEWDDEEKLRKALRHEYESAFFRKKQETVKNDFIQNKTWITI